MDLKTCPITDVTLNCTWNPRNIPSNSWTSVLAFLVDICSMQTCPKYQHNSLWKSMGFMNLTTRTYNKAWNAGKQKGPSETGYRKFIRKVCLNRIMLLWLNFNYSLIGILHSFSIYFNQPRRRKWIHQINRLPVWALVMGPLNRPITAQNFNLSKHKETIKPQS